MKLTLCGEVQRIIEGPLFLFLIIPFPIVMLSPVNNDEYISDVKHLWGSDWVQVTSHGVRSLYQLESGLEPFRKCICKRG